MSIVHQLINFENADSTHVRGVLGEGKGRKKKRGKTGSGHVEECSIIRKLMTSKKKEIMGKKKNS